jgi:hypothetical protein
MNENEFKKLWQTSNEMLEKNCAINKSISEDIAHLKTYNLIGTMKPIKIFTILIAMIWVGIGAFLLSNIYIHAFTEANKFFLFSATIQVGLTAIALFMYLYQTIQIYSIDITEPILKTQKTLLKLKTSTLWVARIMFLQLPVWTTFWWNESMINEWNLFQWSITAGVTLLSTITALWLFFNIKLEKSDTRWFKLIFKGNEWTPLIKSIELLNLIEDYSLDETK